MNQSTVNDAVGGRLIITTASGERYKVQQGEHGEERNEREGDSHGVGLFEPDVEEHLGDEGNGACDEGEQPVPHDPDPRALGAVSAQEVEGAAVGEDALLDQVLLAGRAHGELAELVREDEAADRGADAEEEGAVGEYEERVSGGWGDALPGAVVRVVFEEGEELDLDDYE